MSNEDQAQLQASPAAELIGLIYESAGISRQAGRSWRILNHSLREGLKLAIQAGFHFNPTDFDTFGRTYGMAHWQYGAGGGEGYYGLAVQSGNLSACKSFEAWKGRNPFRCDGKRLFVGAKFLWNGEEVVCTGFTEDGRIVARSYDDQNESQKRKSNRIYKINLKELRTAPREKESKLENKAESA
jgi:hypothetical protein